MTKSSCVYLATKLVVMLAAVWLVACRPAQAAPQKLMQLERTACMGPCPVDRLTVYDDGRLEYEGEKHAPRTGTYVGQLTAAERHELVAKFEAANFFALQNNYVSTKLDLPTKYISYWRGGRTKRIQDYDGAPAVLKELEAALITLIKANRWKQSAASPAK